MWIRQILVAVVGLASGFAVAAGLFSFIIGLGVVSDFADRTHTGKHVMLYFSDFYPEDQNSEMCAMADFWDGAWEKPWSTSVFL